MKGKNIWCTFFVVFLAIVMSINISLFNGTASAETIDFSENFEAGYDGWLHYDGSVSEYGSQTNIVYRDSYAFKMTGFIDSNGAYSGNFQHLLNIAVLPSTQFSFAYRFPSKDVSYVGYYLEFNNGKLGYYISLFSGSFINISQTYLLQYRNEASNTWHTHTANIYDNYKTAFGTIPAGLRITGIYMMMGDPYYTGSTQTAYFDEITITSGAPLPPSGGVWEFNEGSGTTVHDSSGNNHHGIVQGAKWVPGLSGSALDFDGINDKVDLPDDEFKLQEFTVSCWVNFKNCGTKPIFCVSNTALYGGWNLGLIDDSHFRLLTGNIDGAIIDEAQTSTSVSSGVWYHVVGVKTLSSLRIYLNGVLSGQDTTVSPVVYTNCVYGDVFYPFIAHGGVQNDLYYYKGFIDEVKLYNRALSSSEIRTLFESYTIPGTTPPETTEFTEDFETGYDGWAYYDGSLSYANTQTSTVHQGIYAYKMTGTIDSDGAYSGNYQHSLNIVVQPNTQLTVAYRFPSKQVSYIGYYLEFSTGKLGYYISLFSGSFINISQTYLLQYRNEATNTWYTHTANIYDNYKTAFGAIPAGLRITGIYVMMGDPYYTGNTQTAFYDTIHIGPGDTTSPTGAVWKFDEGSGTTVRDSSGNNHNGVRQGATWTSGVSGSALEFDGINDKVDLPDNEFKLQEFTISCWVNFKNCGTKPIFCVSNTALYGGWNLGLVDDSHFRLLTGNIDGAILDEVQTSTSVSSGVWYHIVGVKTPSSLRIYLNGVLSGQDTTVSPVVYTNCVYGDVFYPFIAHGGVQNDLYYYKGFIDEVQLYNRALSSSEIRTLFESYTIPDTTQSTLSIDFNNPIDGDTLSGIHVISGTTIGDDIGKVQIKIDSGSWFTISGTMFWSYNWDTTTVINGVHKISARCYKEGQYSEISSLTVTIDNTLPEKPDLFLNDDDISFSNQNPAIGETITIYARVKNQGQMIGTATVNFYARNPKNQNSLIGSNRILVKPGESITASTLWNVPSEGSYSIFVDIADCELEDAKENNNDANKLIMVGGSEQPTLMISLGLTNLASYEEETTRTVPISIYCYNSRVSNVTLRILQDANLSITSETPPITLNPGEKVDFLLKIKVPKLDNNVTVGWKKIVIQAMGDNGIVSNAEAVDILIHEPGKGIPGFEIGALLVSVAVALLLTIYCRRKRENNT